MKNCEKYKTVSERARAFRDYHRSHYSEFHDLQFDEQTFDKVNSIVAAAYSWLNLEAEVVEPLPCPFCGSNCCCVQTDDSNNKQYVWCENCGYSTGSNFSSEHDAVKHHNRVARAIAKAGGAE